MTTLLTEGCLKPHPFLDGCSADFQNRFEEFSCQASFAAGEVILREGDYADRFYLICDGKVVLEERTQRLGAATQTLSAEPASNETIAA